MEWYRRAKLDGPTPFEQGKSRFRKLLLSERDPEGTLRIRKHRTCGRWIDGAWMPLLNILCTRRAEPARAILWRRLSTLGLRTSKVSRKLTESSPGQRTQDQTHLLQGQGLQEAHPAQSDAIQGWKGTACCNPCNDNTILTPSRHPCSPKESVDMIANNPVMVVKRSLFSTRRPRQRRRSC